MPPLKPVSTYIPLHQLIPGQFQPREHFDETLLQVLADSLKNTQGVLQPLIVRPIADDRYEIIAGERRFRAAQLAQLEEVHCLVTQYTDKQALEAAILENIHRTDLNPIEEAQAYQRMVDDFDYSHEAIGLACSKSRTAITNTLRLLKLEKSVQSLLIQGCISEGHGKVLAGLQPHTQYELAQKCLNHHWSVRQLEKMAQNYQQELKPPKSTTKTSLDPNIQSLEKALSNYLGCPAHIYYEHHKAQLSIDFHNLDILEGVLKKIGFQSDDLPK